ncbi:MAG: ferrochelatase [Candidatus Kapabacteria bacterium]|jgi:ferrochelatase|nr:ferrochelatase [Candidatus Kapabacteria bacterium]
MKKGVLLVNLGSPESPTAKDVKPYLDEFLMDKYVIDVPYWLRVFLVRGIIIGFRNRAEKSAEAYSQIWWDEGSPLIVISERLHKKVQAKTDIPVVLAMRYGKPSIESGLKELHQKGITDVLVLPLYPQHAMASTQTITELANTIQKKRFPDMKLTHFPAFYNRKDYIKALAESMKKSLEGYDYEKLVFSYHGIPERHVRKTGKPGTHKKFVKDEYCCKPDTPDSEFCYRTHCFETTRQVIEYLGIPREKVMETFQSRLSGDKWLDPYTDVEINNLAKNGIKKIAVVTPAFVSDCLETLEEIAMRAKADFIENGGEEFLAIPCLNDDDDWCNVVVDWIGDFQKT